MTREKEIEQAMKDSVAETIYASGWGITPQVTDLLECAFTKGAEWADRNPKFSKQAFIEKTCEWLKENVSKYSYVIKVEDTEYRKVHFTDSLIEDFCKAMEE